MQLLSTVMLVVSLAVTLDAAYGQQQHNAYNPAPPVSSPPPPPVIAYTPPPVSSPPPVVSSYTAPPPAPPAFNFNCPGFGHNAIVRLRNCAQWNTNKYLSMCSTNQCGNGGSVVSTRDLNGDNVNFQQFKVVTIAYDDKPPQPGYARLISMSGSGGQMYFAAQAPESSFTSADGQQYSGKQTYLTTYVQDMDQSNWKLDLPFGTDPARTCRFMISNPYAGGKFMGLPARLDGPKTNNGKYEIPTVSFTRPANLGDNWGLVWEVEVLQPAPAQ